MPPNMCSLAHTLGSDLHLVWSAPSTTNRDRKDLLRTGKNKARVTGESGVTRASQEELWKLQQVRQNLVRTEPIGRFDIEQRHELMPTVIVRFEKCIPRRLNHRIAFATGAF